MPTPEQVKQAQIEHLMRRLMDQGRVVESGWMTYRLAMSPDAPPIQLRECRLAFWHGASFLFAAIMHALEAGEDATDGDLRRMDRIARELHVFEEMFKGLGNAEKLRFTCPRCGAISHNLNDIKHGYCGACHDWS